MVKNENQHSSDYDNLKDVFRPSHADFTYFSKYGIRTIAEEDALRHAKLLLALWVGYCQTVSQKLNIDIKAYTSQVGHIALEKDYTRYDLSKIEDTAVRCPDPEKAEEMIALINEVKSKGDTIGGIITCWCEGTPWDWRTFFGKLHAALGSAMLSINAVKRI
jgi:chorismate synthase